MIKHKLRAAAEWMKEANETAVDHLAFALSWLGARRWAVVLVALSASISGLFILTHPKPKGPQVIADGSMPGFAAPFTLPSQLKYNCNTTGCVSRSIASKLGDVVSVLDFLPQGQPDGTTDNTTGIQAAITAAVGRELRFPAGRYIFTSTLVLQNNTVYSGDGWSLDGTKGTQLQFQGLAGTDAVQINNPINTNTVAKILIRDLQIYAQAGKLGVGKAVLADTGSTFLTLSNVGISFNTSGAIGVLLDQSEQVVIEKSRIATATSGTVSNPSICLWLVNGTEHNGSAARGYTNRITVRESDISTAVQQANVVLIADDGGVAHIYKDNNHNGGDTQIRLADLNDVTISGSEFEASNTYGIYTASTHVYGAASTIANQTVDINDNFFIGGGTYLIGFDSSAGRSVTYLKVNNNSFVEIVGGAKPLGSFTSAVSNPTAYGNIGTKQNTTTIITDVNYGSLGFATADYVPYNNELSGNVTGTGPNWVPAWTGSITNPALGNGTLLSTYSRHGNLIVANVMLTMGSTTTFGSGAWFFSLPYTEGFSQAWVAPAFFFKNSTGAAYQGTAYLPAGSSLIRFWASDATVNNVNATNPITWTTGDILVFTISYAIGVNTQP